MVTVRISLVNMHQHYKLIDFEILDRTHPHKTYNNEQGEGQLKLCSPPLSLPHARISAANLSNFCSLDTRASEMTTTMTPRWYLQAMTSDHDYGCCDDGDENTNSEIVKLAEEPQRVCE